MAAASANNGLLLPDAQPWHLRASYQTYDEAGKAKEQGIFEEYWVNPKKDRVGYTSDSFTQTDYLLESGHFRAGTPRWAGLDEQLVRHSLVHPMPNPSAVANASYEREDLHIGAEAFSCVTVSVPVSGEGAEPLPSRPVYCFDRDSEKPVLRFEESAGDGYETHFNNPAQFGGRMIARDIRISHAGKPFLALHVQTLEPLQPGDAVFEPPTDAVKPPPQRIRISASLAQTYLVQGVAPDYPLLAEHAGVQGTVVLQVLIGADGRVLQSNVVSAPSKDLGMAGVDAVRRWTYRPYRANGEALEVVTEVKMQFHIPKK